LPDATTKLFKFTPHTRPASPPPFSLSDIELIDRRQERIESSPPLRGVDPDLDDFTPRFPKSLQHKPHRRPRLGFLIHNFDQPIADPNHHPSTRHDANRDYNP
jgi:hypothetical protein